MPHFDIIRKSSPKKTFRVASVMGSFDIQSEHIQERFVGDINLPQEWKIGLIVGNSGTGKTTIAKELFPNSYITNFEYNHECILDDMPQGKSVQEITKTFNAVGFSSPPSWLKPYSVLSNGEKMRCDIARAILSDEDLFVFDEFTSVIDRNVAKIGSFAMQKALRKTENKKMIAVTCHFDVEEWLLPDWVFNTNDMSFRLCEGQKKNRPNIKFAVYEIKNNKELYWKKFARYHYLSNNFNKAAHTYIATINDDVAAFCAILPFPHPIIKNVWKVHRIVVLPDYQGIGIGSILNDYIAQMYIDDDKQFIILTSNPAFIHSMSKSSKWIATRKPSRVIGCSKTGKIHSLDKKSATSRNRITCSFKYVGKNGKENS